MTITALLLAAPGALAADDYEADPHRLINHYDEVSRYGAGADLWRVWACDTDREGPVPDVGAALDILNGEISAVFDWLSTGRYDLQFEAGGTVTVAGDNRDDCVRAVFSASTPSAAAGVFIITDEPGWSGAGSPGYRDQDLSPANHRYALVSYDGVFSYSIEVSAHELGHAMYWPHSYTGPSEYDNPIDLMSAGFGAYGTLAVNRYAAGWVDPADVAVYDGTPMTVDLLPVGSPGTQLLAIPGGTAGEFFALDARGPAVFDERTSAHGVTIHEVRHDCASSFFCAGTLRRHTPQRLDGDAYSHVLGVGETRVVGGIEVSVTATAGDGYRVSLSSAAPDGLAIHDPRTGYWTLDDGRGFYYGIPADLPMACDWDGDGIATPGLYRQTSGYLYLRHSNTFGFADVSIYYGIPEDIPVCGDWDGDGVDTIGIYRPSNATFYLRNSNTFGFADVSFPFGAAGDIPLAGDWNGDGIDTPAVFRPGSGELVARATNDPGWSPATYYLEPDIPPGTAVFSGDFDGDGRDSLGYHAATITWYSNSLGTPKSSAFVWGIGETPVSGVWSIP